MSLWLNTRGNTVLSIAICDRCKRKVPYSDIRPDGNIPGIRVCGDGCSDQFDPYRLPARQSERVSLRFPRPDAPLDQYEEAYTTYAGYVNGSALVDPGFGN